MTAGWIQQIKEQLLLDKKKSIILGVLICTLMVVGARQLFQKGPAPEEVMASPTATAKPAAAAPVREQPAAAAGSARGSPEKSCEAAAAAPEANVRHVSIAGMSRELQRDLFDTNWSQFSAYSLDEQPDGQAATAKKTAYWGRLAAAAIEYRKLRKDEVAQLKQELSALELQSTMTGDLPLAYISGRLVHEGDEMSGFSVLRIRERHVVLSRSGRSYELTMP